MISISVPKTQNPVHAASNVWKMKERVPHQRMYPRRGFGILRVTDAGGVNENVGCCDGPGGGGGVPQPPVAGPAAMNGG